MSDIATASPSIFASECHGRQVGAPFAKAFGRAIAAERTFADISQAGLAERLGWARPTISAIEAGERQVTMGEVPEICQALGCSVLDLLIRAGEADLEKMRIDRDGRRA